MYLECKLQQDSYVFISLNTTKRYKGDIYRQANNKQDTADMFRCRIAYGKVTMAVLDAGNKQARYIESI